MGNNQPPYLSPALKGSIVGYNGVSGGKSCSTSEQFFEKWVQRKTNQKQNSVGKKGQLAAEFLKEALEKKNQVMTLITDLLDARYGRKTIKTPVIPPVKKQRNTLPKPISNKELEPTNELDIYYTDGGTLYNGSPYQKSTICVVKNNKVFVDKNVGNRTNNEAEYIALIAALENIPKNKKAIIYSDSKLIVYTALNLWKVKMEHLKKLHQQVRDLIYNDIQIFWVPRERNKAGHYLEEKYHV